MELVERSRFVPKADCETPVPAWKAGIRDHAGEDVLPATDRARSEAAEVLDR
jgi:hypothetical protein